MRKTLTIKQKEINNKSSDIKFFGDGDTFKLISKASSKSQGWMKATKAMQVDGGCVVQVTTHHKNPDGSHAIAEALTFVPNVIIEDVTVGGTNGAKLHSRRLVAGQNVPRTERDYTNPWREVDGEYVREPTVFARDSSDDCEG